MMFLFSLLSSALLVLATPIEQHRRVPAGVPEYVTKYAPMVYLYTTDPYRPSNIGSQLTNTQPELNYTLITDAPKPLTLNNLNALNDINGDNGTNVYLTSKINAITLPAWLHGVTPNSDGKTVGAYSCAIIVNDHGNGEVDAFYMYFYAYNYGGVTLGVNFDDHVGDWEHNMVRFQNGVPQAIWYSQHSNGEAFTYDAVEKYKGLRPISFSANGSHANYAENGTHSHDIPDLNGKTGILVDYTNNGPIWDPTLGAYYYTYDATTQKFAAYDNSAPVNWLYFIGQWGDDSYPTSNPHQYCLFGISALCKYTSGPTGPIDKDLNRTDVCPDNGYPCIVRPVLGP